MSWPTSPNSPRRPRRPRSQPLTLRQLQRRNRSKVTARIVGVMLGAIILPVVLAVAVIVVIGQVDRPAAVPPGFAPPTALPRAAAALPLNHMLFSSDRNGTYAIYDMRNDGQQAKALVEDPRYDAWGVRLSPDRYTAIFYRTPTGEERDPAGASLWAVGSGGGEPVLLRPAGLDDWVVQSHAEWNQYGSALVMSGGSRDNPQIHVTDALGQNPQRLTNRPGLNTDPSFTPDGREIFFVGCPTETCEPEDRELYRMPVGGGEPTRLTNDRRSDREPYVSPQSDHLVWLSLAGDSPGDGWQLEVADRHGGTIDNPRAMLALSGETVLGRPQWSLDGTTIYVHRKATGRATSGIWAIPLTGKALPAELTLGQPGNHEDPSG